MIDLTLKEKNLIIAAIRREKESVENMDTGYLEFIHEMDEDIQKEIILLSRTQIDSIVYYLDTLFYLREYDSKEVLRLQHKLNALSDLP